MELARSDHNFAPNWLRDDYRMVHMVRLWGRDGYEVRLLIEPVAAVMPEDDRAARQQREADEDCYDRYAAGA